MRRALDPIGEVVAPSRGVLDLSSADSVAAAVRESRPDLIVNAGAYTEVDRAESEPEVAMAVNGMAPRVLAEEALRCGAMVVHYSTAYVFDGAKAGAYGEEDPVAPLNIYGRTKLAGETALLESGCPCFIFRTNWVYGTRGRNFFLTMLRLARDQEELRIVDDQFGAPTTARFVADATAAAIAKVSPQGGFDREQFGEFGGIYHMTAAGRTSWHEFATEILQGQAVVLRPVAGSQYRAAAERPRNSLLDNAKLDRRFGISPPDWRSGLRSCLKELSEQ